MLVMADGTLLGVCDETDILAALSGPVREQSARPRWGRRRKGLDVGVAGVGV